jgi:hypothetical protein
LLCFDVAIQINPLGFGKEVDGATKVASFDIDQFSAKSSEWQMRKHPITAPAPHPMASRIPLLNRPAITEEVGGFEKLS